MTWQLRNGRFRHAIHLAVERAGGCCALAGTVGVQLHVAAKLGLDKRGPPAHAIALVPLDAATALDAFAAGIPIEAVDPRGFEASIVAARRVIEIEGEPFPVASPEHILGLQLAATQLPADAQWACFVLMRSYAGELDLEEVRGFLKRLESSERQALLAELAYLAA